MLVELTPEQVCIEKAALKGNFSREIIIEKLFPEREKTNFVKGTKIKKRK